MLNFSDPNNAILALNFIHFRIFSIWCSKLPLAKETVLLSENFTAVCSAADQYASNFNSKFNMKLQFRTVVSCCI